MRANVIRGKIIEQYGTISKWTKAHDWPPTKMNRILNGKQDIDASDIKTVAASLKIEDPAEIVSLFLSS